MVTRRAGTASDQAEGTDMTPEQAAHRMGMPRREVLDVRETPDGTAVLTHDGQWTLLCTDGTMRFGIAEPVEPVVEPDVKPAPKRTRRT